MLKIFTRWQAIKLGFQLIYFATGTAKVGVLFSSDTVEFLGKDLLPESGTEKYTQP